MIDKKADARPSIHNVAAYAGVSIATVSKVMQGVATVRKENVIAVQNAIEALGYRINPLGAELRRGQRKLVGAIIADFQNQKSAQLLSELEKQVESRGYTLMAASSRGSEDREADLVGRMQDWRVAGIVVESVSGRQKASLLLEEGPPAVFLGNHWTKGVHDLVVDDVPTAIRDALKLSRRRLKSVFLAEGFREEYLKDEIEQAGDCLVRKVSDLDMSGPVFLIDEAGQTVEHSNRPDEGRTSKVTRLYSDVLNTSVAAVTLLFERLENPETPKAVQKVAMKVSSSP